MPINFEDGHIASLFENATEGMVITDDQARVILINPSACAMFGYGKDELVGETIEKLLPEAIRKTHMHLREDFYRDPRNRVMGHGRDLYAQKKNGETFPVEVSLSTYVREGRRYVIAFVIDITRRKEIEASMMRQQLELEQVTDEMRRLNAELEAKVEERTVILREALEKLEESQEELSAALSKERELSEIKTRFVSMASHEFRTPLSTVLSSASLLAKYQTTEEQEKRDRHIEKIRNSVRHLNDLLDDFLSLGKLEEGKVHTQHEACHLPELLDDLAEEMRALAKPGQQIIIQHEGAPMIYSDKKLIRNILINLVSNAIKFSGENKLIRVLCFVNNDVARLEVADEGMGVSDEDRQHLFSSFFRARNAVNIQGTGLGLHIVNRYVNLLNGSIALDSELGKGTRVSITIPVN